MTNPDAWSRRRFLAGTVATAGASALALAGCNTERAGSPDGARRGGDGARFAGSLVDPPFEKPDVTFTTMDGEPFPFRSATAGQLTFLFFGYTNCPDQCPVYLQSLARARDAVGSGPGSRPQVLFVGVDIARDTPKQLKTYLSRIDPTFIGLTGTEDVIAKANAAVKFPPIEIGQPDADGEYLVGHYSKAVVFTPDDEGHRLYGFDVRQQQFAADLPRLARGDYR